ncbi:hypothetical protein KQI63_12115 [bacterium]|nr:hypothetical protein [bacterium]
MTDKLDKVLGPEDDPYGGSPARTILQQLFRNATPESLAVVTEQYLERLTLIEMILEEELRVEISKEQFEDYLARNFQDVREETTKMAQLFYGRIASREG